MLEVMYFFNEGNLYAAVRCIMFQFSTTSVSLPVRGRYPAVGMHPVGEEVRFFLGLNRIPEEDSLMSVEEWHCLNDI